MTGSSGALQDGAAGDNFDPFGSDPIAGNDVFLGDGGFDETLGEGGDDIVVGSEGGDKYRRRVRLRLGHLQGRTLRRHIGLLPRRHRSRRPPRAAGGGLGRRPRPLLPAGRRCPARPTLTSCAATTSTRPQILLAGAKGSVLTNLDLISGLRAFLGTAAAGPDGITGNADDQFGSGNILLGGDGSDILEGRGGDDILDGDRWLNVRISVRQNLDGTGPEIRSVN